MRTDAGSSGCRRRYPRGKRSSVAGARSLFPLTCYIGSAASPAIDLCAVHHPPVKPLPADRTFSSLTYDTIQSLWYLYICSINSLFLILLIMSCMAQRLAARSADRAGHLGSMLLPYLSLMLSKCWLRRWAMPLPVTWPLASATGTNSARSTTSRGSAGFLVLAFTQAEIPARGAGAGRRWYSHPGRSHRLPDHGSVGVMMQKEFPAATPTSKSLVFRRIVVFLMTARSISCRKLLRNPAAFPRRLAQRSHFTSATSSSCRPV